MFCSLPGNPWSKNDRMWAGAGGEIEDGVEARAVADDVGRFHHGWEIFVARRIGGDRRGNLLRRGVSCSAEQDAKSDREESRKIFWVHGATFCRILRRRIGKFAAFGRDGCYEFLARRFADCFAIDSDGARHECLCYKSRAMANFLRTVEFLCLSLWLGSDVFLSFVVAPGAFRVLATAIRRGRWLGIRCGGCI